MMLGGDELDRRTPEHLRERESRPQVVDVADAQLRIEAHDERGHGLEHGAQEVRVLEWDAHVGSDQRAAVMLAQGHVWPGTIPFPAFTASVQNCSQPRARLRGGRWRYPLREAARLVRS